MNQKILKIFISCILGVTICALCLCVDFAAAIDMPLTAANAASAEGNQVSLEPAVESPVESESAEAPAHTAPAKEPKAEPEPATPQEIEPEPLAVAKEIKYTTASSIKLPILMYHSFDENDNPEYSISAEEFDRHLTMLEDLGYTTVGLDDVLSWVDGYLDVLPEKPIAITIDDGYQNVYDVACPILVSHGCKAMSFTVGVTFGRDVYTDGQPLSAKRYGYGELLEMNAHGILNGCHGWNLHQVALRDPEPVRKGAVKLPGESSEQFKAFLKNDIQTYFEEMMPVVFFAYPFGNNSALAQSVLEECGIRVSVISTKGINTITKGKPSCLARMKRIGAHGMTAEELAEILESYN